MASCHNLCKLLNLFVQDVKARNNRIPVVSIFCALHNKSILLPHVIQCIYSAVDYQL